MNVSDSLIEEMGFRRLSEPKNLSLRFVSVALYSFTSITWPSELKQDIVISDQITACFGSTPNPICQSLLGNDYFADQEKWLLDSGNSGPFLLIRYDSSKCFNGTTSWILEKGDEFHTFGVFTDERRAFLIEARNAFANVLGLIASRFAEAGQVFNLKHCDDTVFGRDIDQRVWRDISFTMSATGIVQPRLDVPKLQDYLSTINETDFLHATSLLAATSLIEQSSREMDTSRRFQLLFSATEKVVESSFKILKRSGKMEIKMTESLGIASLANAIAGNPDNYMTLVQKVNWLRSLVWCESDADLFSRFEKLKKLRDDISHGNTARVETMQVTEALSVALKFLSLGYSANSTGK